MENTLKTWFVELSLPWTGGAGPDKGVKIHAFRRLVRDALSPDLMALYQVHAKSSQDAIAQALLGGAKRVF